MRRRIAVVLVTVLATMTLAMGASADQLGPCNGEGPGNSGYAKHHIVVLARSGGVGNSGHNPGAIHSGFSLCLGVHG